MSEWRVIIADDEPAARRGVRQLLEPYPHFTVVAECRNGAEVLAALDAGSADVLFLDIEMPGLGGFDVIRLREAAGMPLTVFLTAWDHYAIRAFEAEAIDYLLKPVSAARFAATIRRVERQLRSGTATRPPSFRINTARGVAFIELPEVDWIEAAGNYARLWVGKRSHLVREALAELEPRLEAHGFIRLHRSALARLASIRALQHQSDGVLCAQLESGVTIPVARRRQTAVRSALAAFRAH